MTTFDCCLPQRYSITLSGTHIDDHLWLLSTTEVLYKTLCSHIDDHLWLLSTPEVLYNTLCTHIDDHLWLLSTPDVLYNTLCTHIDDHPLAVVVVMRYWMEVVLAGILKLQNNVLKKL